MQIRSDLVKIGILDTESIRDYTPGSITAEKLKKTADRQMVPFFSNPVIAFARRKLQ
jgi:hypothetical protein